MAIQFKDYYETLGVSKSASQDEIKKAFRKLARKHHPDVSKDKAAAETKFKEINEAYEVLGDPDKRKRYDTLGSDWERGAPPPGPQQGGASYGGGFPGGQEAEFHFGGTGFSDFFEEFFGSRGRSFGGGGFARGREYPQAGQDIEADFMVTLEEALKGGRRKISFQRSNRAKPETYEVRIPPGVHEGQRIRLAGQGEAGSSGGTAGDLYLCVKLAQHPDFRVEGGDLVFELQVPVWQAVIGAECAVPTLEGSVRLKVPAGTQNHQRFRLKQRGLPRMGGGRGDLYVAIDVLLPKTLSKQERALWEQIAAESKPISQP